MRILIFALSVFAMTSVSADTKGVTGPYAQYVGRQWKPIARIEGVNGRLVVKFTNGCAAELVNKNGQLAGSCVAGADRVYQARLTQKVTTNALMFRVLNAGDIDQGAGGFVTAFQRDEGAAIADIPEPRISEVPAER